MGLGYNSILARAETDGPALNTSTTKTSILPAHAKYTPNQQFWAVGKQLHIVARGRISTFTSGTLTLAVGVGSVDAFASQALTLVASQTNITWYLDLMLSVRAVGAGGSATANLIGIGNIALGAAITGGQANLPASAPAVGTSFDPAAAGVIDLLATWSVSNVSNSIQVHQYALKELGGAPF